MTQVLPGALVVFLPILAVFALSLVSKGAAFRWANVFKLYLTLLFLGVGVYGHLIEPKLMLELVPPFFPFRLESIYITGIIEIAFAILLWTKWQRPTGIAIMIYLLLVIPFNIWGWTVPTNTPNYIDSPNYLWLRVPMQALFMAFAYFGTRPENRARGTQAVGA